MKIASLVLVVLLSACASQVPETNYYLLRSDQNLPSSKLNPSRDFSVGTVDIAPYLNQLGLVMETGDGEMHVASQNLWAEPVYDSVRSYLLTEIALTKGQELLPAKLTQDTTVVNIRIDQLHGTVDGNAKILAYWWLTDKDNVVAIYRFSETQPLEADGYTALVAAEKILLAGLAKEVAASLVPAAN